MTQVTPNVAGTDRELIAFRIGEQEFCVDIMGVRGIRGWTPATPLPRSPAYMKGVINLRGTVLPIIDLGARFGLQTGEPTELRGGVVMIVETEAGQRAGLLVDAIHGQRQVVIKSLETNYRHVEGVAAATILGDGRVALILDIDALVTTGRRRNSTRSDLKMAS